MTAGTLPRLSLHIEAAGVPYSVVVNDVPVWSDPRGRAAAIDSLPVVEWLASGGNSLGVRIGAPVDPDPAASARVEAALRISLDGEAPILLTSLTVTETAVDGAPAGRFVIEGPVGNRSVVPAATGTIVVEPIRLDSVPSGRSASRAIELPWQWPRWRYLDAPTIMASARTRASLEASYRQLWNLLQANDRAGLATMLGAKVSELVGAYPEDRKHIEPILGLEGWLDDPDMTVKPLVLESSQLEIIGDGKLARLVDRRGNGPLAFVSRDGLLSNYLDTIFCLAGSGWLLVR